MKFIGLQNFPNITFVWDITPCDPNPNPNHIFSPFWHKEPFVFRYKLFDIRSTMAYLCPKMINFDAVVISECPTEVITFCWRSV